MAYNIRKIKNGDKVAGGNYFLDANIWIKVLRPPNNPSNEDLLYINFFDNFIKSEHSPKIYMPSLLVSEIINRLMRMVGMPQFIKDKGIDLATVDSRFYKEKYRGTTEFARDYELLIDDINLYADYIIAVQDGFGEMHPWNEIVVPVPKNLDFNDFYYYQFCLKNNLKLVTDDIDFYVEDLEIFTANNRLYKKMTDNVIPITSSTSAFHDALAALKKKMEGE